MDRRPVQDGMPAEEDMPLSLEQQNTYRARYARMRPGWRPATAVYEALIRERLAAGMRVLDLGCGRGGALEQLGPAVAHPLGLDPDHRSLAEHRLPDLPRAVALADALPLPAASVDLVLASWVLEHLPDPARVFAEVARALRPGGAFIVLAPGARSPAALLNRTLRPLQGWLVPRLYGRAETDAFPVVYRANTRRQVEALAQGAGLALDTFRAIEDPTYFAFHPLVFRLSATLACRAPRALAEHFVAVCVKPER
ncbi:MAG: class I SAM-dependent methyltransferase [Anaerolineae bacterium]|nr:class I SAM-dependent methyltransferase [Anaerolineae bacterium]